MQIMRFEVGGMMGSNAYLLWDEDTKEAAMFDPGFPDERYMQVIEENGLNLDKIVLTHGHFDHIGGIEQLKEATGAKIYIPEKDKDFLVDPKLNLSGDVGLSMKFEPADVTLKEGDVITVGPEELKVIETPGHTPGSASFIGKNYVIVGDVLFRGSIGRTDFPDGSYGEMEKSLKRLMELPGNYQVLPGHGEITTIERERQYNPFINF